MLQQRFASCKFETVPVRYMSLVARRVSSGQSAPVAVPHEIYARGRAMAGCEYGRGKTIQNWRASFRDQYQGCLASN